MESLMKGMVFCCGWITGGGILAIISMAVLEFIFGTGYNTTFVGGLMWGTFGTLCGVLMVRGLDLVGKYNG